MATMEQHSSSSSSSSTSSFYALNTAAEWKKQLITKEDPNHVHKTLGILVLCSYIFRLCHIGKQADLGFPLYPAYTVPTLLLHLALNASSFEFKLPPKRIKDGYRIWPEYRLHSIVFSCRSLLMMFVVWYEQEHLQTKQEYHIWNIIIILSTMAAADWSSRQSTVQSGFARELDVPAAARYFFSAAQLFATSLILMGHRRYTMHFLMVIILQGNAFLMTIRRKNLASHALLTSIYAALIVGASVIGMLELQYAGMNTMPMAICNLAVLLRTGPRLVPIVRIFQDNKYILWTTLYVLQEVYVRPNSRRPLTWPELVLNLFLGAAMLSLGVYRHVQEQRTEIASTKKTIKPV